MHKVKDFFDSVMPSPGMKLKALVLNGSLKHKPHISNTGELSGLVTNKMKEYGVESEIIRLADKNIPAGVKFKEGSKDDWPAIAEKIIKTDILIIASPIWWGGRSSLTQRIIERFDAFDELYHNEGRSKLYNKTAGVVITGSEDGAQHCIGTILEVLMFMGFTIPPECAAYWVGEVGMPPSKDRKKRLRNKGTQKMALKMARNLVYYAQLLKENPLIAG